ncbi:hypothetical protein ACTFIV_008539 [Dictyostelium citrinum]
MKTRFSSIDIRTTVVNLQKSLIGLRLANLYDLSPRVFLLKFSKPDCKKNLIIESGIRIHSTNFVRDKGDHTPAPFSLNLRKYLKTKRLESVKQLGVDRVVDFTFGSGVAVQHLIVELYSIGNIILTDGEYRILAILRTHQYNQDESVAIGDVYPIDRVKVPTEFTESLIDQIIENTQDKKETLKQVFNKSLDFGPELIEHCLLSAGLQPSTKLEQYDHSKFSKALRDSFIQGQKIFDNSIQSKGYIVLKDPKQLKPQQQQKQQKQQQQQQQSNTLKISNDLSSNNNNNNPDEKKEMVIYEEFVPYLYKQYESKKFIEFESFDAAVDQFFSEIESQKVEQQRIAQEQVVLKKLDKVKEDQQRRIDSLFANEAENIRKAQLIEANLQEVDQCILIIRSGVASSMDWETLNQLLKEEKKKNPYSVATKIHRLKLESNQITLSLTDNFLYDDDDDDDDEDDESDNSDLSDEEDQNTKKSIKKSKTSNQKPNLIDVDISLSAHANARKYYDSKKQSHDKAQKTISQAEFALKAAEKKTRQQLSETKSKNSMIAMRKIFWFEKFHWFISSDNYIVVSGRDAQQNELLYKKYLEKDDIYVHADIFGSTSCVIKNPNGGEIPPNTLIQAGTMTMCYSNAWSAKVVTSAYWVYSHQVSKTAPSGEFLTTGSFMIRGKKNYLPHSQLVMGFGFMFKIDDSCLGNHLNERKPIYGEGDDRLLTTLDSSNNNNNNEDGNIESSETGEKHLRKFERTKLKKEQKEQKELEELEKLSLKDENSDSTTTNTTSPIKSTTTQSTTSTANKYKIQLVSNFKDDEDEDDEDDDEEENKKEEGRTKGYVSAHQRKLMKKEGISLEEAAQLEQQLKKEKEEKEKKKQETKSEEKVKSEPQKHLLPSQKNKLKKIKEKYGHQDEEERQERMEILGSAGSKKENKKKDKKGNKKGGKPTNNNTNKDKDKKPTNVVADKQKVEEIIKLKEDQNKKPTSTTTNPTNPTTTTTSTTSTEKPQPKVEEKESDSEEDEESSSSSSESEGEGEGEGEESEEKKEKRKSRKERREEKIKEEQEIKRLLEEENSSKAVDDQKDITNIDTLTGQPRDDDILHFAIPVVAPYSVFNNYKFKVKLTPGHLKRGKAAKQAAQVILQNPQLTKREKELIKHVKDEDLTSNMLADVRLHAPNLLQAQKKEKKERKEKAKEKANELKENYKDKDTNNNSSGTTTTTTTTTTSNNNNNKSKK